MGDQENWVDFGDADELAAVAIGKVTARNTTVAVSCRDGQFGAISNVCNHAGGPLGEGRLDGDYVVCPWHDWKFHRVTGVGEPGFEDDARAGLSGQGRERPRARRPRGSPPSATRSRTRRIRWRARSSAAPGRCALAGISTTGMDIANPRFSGSDHLLGHALKAGRGARRRDAAHPAQRTQVPRLRGLLFEERARACTWPCSITQMDGSDEMDRVYEALVHWADAVIVASPIRWGAASSLYFKMAERLNCVQNAITIRNQVLIRNKVAGFIIIGGQDNIQAVAGQMLGFFSELGFIFPQFPFIAHSRGWSAEDMERNVEVVRNSTELADGARDAGQARPEPRRSI